MVALWFVPCAVCAQGVESARHRVGLSGGLGVFFVGVDDDGAGSDDGGAASIGLSYGYVATKDFEVGAIATYWSSNASMPHALSVAARARGILTFADRAGEVGLELQCGYLAQISADLPDRTHYFNGFGVTAAIDAGVWFSDRIGIFAGPSLTGGWGKDRSPDTRFYLPESSYLVTPGATATLRARF